MTRVLEEKTVKARKSHRCQLCGLSIEVGQTYYTQRNADEREVWTYRAHVECWVALPAFLRSCGLAPWSDEEVDEDEFREFLASDPNGPELGLDDGDAIARGAGHPDNSN